jgi:hypothetical protein
VEEQKKNREPEVCRMKKQNKREHQGPGEKKPGNQEKPKPRILQLKDG